MASKGRSMLLVGALLLAGVWAWQRWPAQAGGGTVRSIPERAPALDIADAPIAAPRAAPVGRIPGDIPPSIESATPAEIAAMQKAEMARSAASDPVATWLGPDGRQHAFAYRASATDEARQHSLDARRQERMRELRADPAGFARRNGLSTHEAERILDGSIELPDRLLD